MHDRAQSLAADLEPRSPDVEFFYASDPHEIGPMLLRCNPDAVFGIKQSHFPGEPQAAAVAHPSVRWFQVGGAGYEHLTSWDAGKLVVTNCRGILAPYLAETVMAAILHLNANLPAYREQQIARQWRPIAFRSLKEQTLAVVGGGALGSMVAANAKALGMRVLCVKRRPMPVSGADEVYPISALDDVLAQSDVVSLHVPLTGDTRRLFDSRRLRAMKRGAVFVNTSRGSVVDEGALIEALGDGHLRAAYLDVFETEPLPPESPLWTMPNVLITPHASDNVVGWETLFAKRFSENLARWNRGDELIGEINP